MTEEKTASIFDDIRKDAMATIELWQLYAHTSITFQDREDLALLMSAFALGYMARTRKDTEPDDLDDALLERMKRHGWVNGWVKGKPSSR